MRNKKLSNVTVTLISIHSKCQNNDFIYTLHVPSRSNQHDSRNASNELAEYLLNYMCFRPIKVLNIDSSRIEKSRESDKRNVI